MMMRFAIQDSVNEALIDIYSSIDLPESRYTRAAQTVSQSDARPYIFNGMSVDSESFFAPNTDAPTQYIPYRDKQLGIEFEVPYNPLWGNTEYRITPHEMLIENGQAVGVLFGSVQPSDGVWKRQYAMKRLSYGNRSTREASIRRGLSSSERDTLQTLTVNGYDVIVYEEINGTHTLHMEIIGTDANFDFSLHYGGSEDGEDLVESLANVLRSVRFIE